MVGKKVRDTVIDYLPRLPVGKQIFNLLAEPYIAGHSLREGMETAHREYAQRRNSTVDILGEGARSLEEATRYRCAYRKILEDVATEFPDNPYAVSVSLKPTAICVEDTKQKGHLLPETNLYTELETIVRTAARTRVTLDMEDHNWTDLSLETAKKMWDSGYENFGIVLQSRLNRTEGDIQNLFYRDEASIPKSSMRVRACIGIYNEPKNIATTSIPEAKHRLVKRIRELFNAGVYVEMATHDHDVIKQVIETIIVPRRIDSSRFEFQFLRGVQNAYDIERELMDRGYAVRYYAPVEIARGDGTPYMIRRLKKNPTLLKHGVKNVMQKLFRIGQRDRLLTS